MTSIRLTGFSGVNQFVDPLLLPDPVGVAASNIRSGYGTMKPWTQPSALALATNTVITGATSLYRFGRDNVSDDTITWMTFTADVDVVRGLVGTDTTERTYFTDGTSPKYVDNTFSFTSVPYPTTTKSLGVPPPTSNPTVAPTGGSSSTKESRAYVWTWVTSIGEESAPSPANTPTASTAVDATWAVTFNEAPPSLINGVTYNGSITARRLYRSAVTSTGGVLYLFVAQISNTSNGYTYNDTIDGTLLGGAIPSTFWQPPPAALVGLTAMWNGMMAGFVGKTLYVSEQFAPYAWPVKYSRTTQDTIVGLAVWQQNLLILTSGKPYLLTGSDPSSIGLQPIDASYACVAKRSIREVPGGVVWAAPEGLAYYGTRGSNIITSGLLTREQWNAFAPSTMVINTWATYLIVSYTTGTRSCLIFDWAAAESSNTNGVATRIQVTSYVNSSIAFDMMWKDPKLGNLYLLSTAGRTISKWAAGSTMTALFTSKLFRQPTPMNFSWLQVRADAYPVAVSLVADGTTVVSSQAIPSQAPVRLPSGFKARDWQITVSAAANVQEVALANSMKELQAVV